jgi:hypothetical protein
MSEEQRVAGEQVGESPDARPWLDPDDPVVRAARVREAAGMEPLPARMMRRYSHWECPGCGHTSSHAEEECCNCAGRARPSPCSVDPLIARVARAPEGRPLDANERAAVARFEAATAGKPSWAARVDTPLPVLPVQPPPLLVAYWNAAREVDKARKDLDAARAHAEQAEGFAAEARRSYEQVRESYGVVVGDEQVALEALRAAGVGGGS